MKRTSLRDAVGAFALMVVLTPLRESLGQTKVRGRSQLRAQMEKTFDECQLTPVSEDLAEQLIKDDVPDDKVFIELTNRSAFSVFSTVYEKAVPVIQADGQFPSSPHQIPWPEHFLWLPYPTSDMPVKYTVLSTCNSSFEQVLKLGINVSIAKLKDAIQYRQTWSGRTFVVYGELLSPLVARYDTQSKAHVEALFRIWNFYAKKYSATNPPAFHALSKLNGYAFNSWTQGNFGGNHSADIKLSGSLPYFEGELGTSIRQDFTGRVDVARSKVGYDSRTPFQWLQLPTPAEITADLQARQAFELSTDLEPTQSDATALRAQPFRHSVLLEGLPNEFCVGGTTGLWSWSQTAEQKKGVNLSMKSIDAKPAGDSSCRLTSYFTLPTTAFTATATKVPVEYTLTFRPKVNNQSLSFVVKHNVPVKLDVWLQQPSNVGGRADLSRRAWDISVRIYDTDSRVTPNKTVRIDLAKFTCPTGDWKVIGLNKPTIDSNKDFPLSFSVEPEAGKKVSSTQGGYCNAEARVSIPVSSGEVVEENLSLMLELPVLEPIQAAPPPSGDSTQGATSG